ncbi:S-layer homology domain-containing protein [Candidatus Peregrinibacteria bacterium]|nr:S-layer homology domain-containing protein [Candidatus Peregrinibacteria bacterium]
MFKKFVAALSLWTIFATVMPLSVFAANIPIAGLIKGVTLTVANSDPQTFEPAAGQVLKTAVSFDTANFATELSKSSGSVNVMQGTKVVKILSTWTDTGLPASIADWDGKAIENTQDAQNICGNQGAVCPAGDYQIATHVQYTGGTNTFFDDKTTAFKVYVTPAVAINNLAVAPTPFNPVNQTGNISFATSKDGFITVEIFDAGSLVKTLVANENLTAGTYNKTNKAALAWDGKNAAGQIVPNKTYVVKATSRLTATGNVLDTKTVNVDVNAPATITVVSYTITFTPNTVAGTFDPSPLGNHQNLIFNYQLSKVVDNISVDVKDSKGINVVTKNIGSASSNGSYQWDGMVTTGQIIAPGSYTAVMTASKSGEVSVTASTTFVVYYSNTKKGALQNFAVFPTTFNPNIDDATIEFTNSVEANMTLVIQNASGTIKTFPDYDFKLYPAGTKNSVNWNGTDNSGNTVAIGSYNVVVTMRNDYGAVTDSKVVTVDNSGTSVSDSNDHISGIYLSPSSKFKPEKGDPLKIEFDVKKKLDSLVIVAIKGSTQVELLNQQTTDIANNVELSWDGQDNNGDYASAGSWKIRFKSKIGATQLVAQKSIDVAYDQPKIQELQLSKTRFDNDQGEFTNVLFKVDTDSRVDVKTVLNGQEDNNIVEDMEVSANQWYAVQWDGSGYHFGDNLGIKVIAYNTVNKSIFDTKKITVYLSGDTSVSNKANITNDYIDPPISDGGGTMVVHYNIDQAANVAVTIYKGTSYSDVPLVELANVDQNSGSHDITWNIDSANQLSNGFYTYKIVSTLNSSDTETGLFIVGNIGKATDGSNYTVVKNNSGKIGPNVIVDGKSSKSNSNSGSTTEPPIKSKQCADFKDVKSDNQHCEAIQWAKDAGIFKGYPDGIFGVNKAINRVELLKVIMESLKIQTAKTTGNLGFADVDVTQWYMPYIQAAKNLGIFNGDAGKNTARPGDSSNRVESLKMIFESMKAAGLISQIGVNCPASHDDVPAGTWFGGYICAADTYGLYDPTIDGTFGVGVLSTRGEIAEVLYRLHSQNLF